MITVSLHVCGITREGRLWLATHPVPTDGSTGSWEGWEEVKAPAARAPGHFVAVDCVSTWGADDKEHLHILAITQGGQLWYTSRVEQQDWQPFEDLGNHIGGNWGAFQRVGLTEVSGQLDACVTVHTNQGQGRILHTSLVNTGWTPFEEVTQPTAAGLPGHFIDVDCAYVWAGLLAPLHVCGLTRDGTIWHTIRFMNPLWLPFANVHFLSPNGPTSFANVSLAQGSDTLDLCALADGDLWHTSRSSGNPPLTPASWQQTFDDLSKEASRPGPFRSTSCGDVNGTLHACGTTNDGNIWHTVRTSLNPPSWRPFENLAVLKGNPGSFTHVCVANSTPPPAFGGADQTCSQIQMCISNDNLQIQALAKQGGHSAQIAALQQDVASLEQQGHAHGCF